MPGPDRLTLEPETDVPRSIDSLGSNVRQARKTETTKKVLLLFGSLVLMLSLAEGLLRFFPLLRPHPRTYVGEYDNRQEMHLHGFLVSDPLLGWKMRPNAPRINAQGFRAASDFQPNQACKGIAFAGDSFTLGAAVRPEKTFASLVQAGAPDYCAYNMGIAGYGLDQIWLTVRTQALPLHPKMVIVSFIVDDLSRSEEAYNFGFGSKPAFKLAGGRLVPATGEDRPNFFLRFLQRNSSLWRVVQLADRTLALHYPHGEWWYLNAAILDAIGDDCRKAGVPVLFVYLPTLGWRAFPSLTAYMLRNQANFIDLSQGEFELAPDRYIPNDGHLNEKGHRQVADAVLDFITHQEQKSAESLHN